MYKFLKNKHTRHSEDVVRRHPEPAYRHPERSEGSRRDTSGSFGLRPQDDGEARIQDDGPGMVVICKNITKTYKLFNRNRDRLIDFCSGGLIKRHQLFYALKNVSFEVKTGECLGIVGENGSGKSTLLKIITGTSFPASGTVSTHGRISSLLELGSGFHPELTGRQNIQLNAQFYGFSPEELTEIEEKTKEFSELGAFFDQPLKIYSSGMQVRLGFSMACHVKPDVLIIDEALAVGDAYFQQKCIKQMKTFIDAGVTCLFVSHDPSLVRLLCSRAILLHHGEKIEEGAPKKILNVYNGIISQHNRELSYQVVSENLGAVSHGNHKVTIESVRLQNNQGQASSHVLYNEAVSMEVTCKVHEEVDNCCVGVLITDVYGLEVFGTNTLHQCRPILGCKSGDTLNVKFNVVLSCGAGNYFVTVAAHKGDTHIEETYDWKDNILQFDVVPPRDNTFTGRTYLKHDVQVVRS